MINLPADKLPPLPKAGTFYWDLVKSVLLWAARSPWRSSPCANTLPLTRTFPRSCAGSGWCIGC
jgi:hypothetical protein